jgi:TBC1 domain family member 5
MQDNFFFREPETQRMLLDVLFIYSKLNPDIGYRQGMHELLAPLLWVVHQDAIDHSTVSILDRQADGAELMLDILDQKHREADAFSLFCAVMQTAKSFYEMGDNRDSSPIITKSRRIHEDLLGIFDSELALHLQVAGVLPQIYAIRWIRLLFGREFDFKDVLRVWDILFAEKLRSDIIDLTCVALLLRMRWKLVEADYSEAITTLTHVKLPNADDDPRDLVRDAIAMDKSRSAETGAAIVQRYSGRKPKVQSSERPRLSLDETPTRRGSRTPQYRPSPSASPARFSGPQRQLESLFSDVSGGIKSRTEGWNVSKAVRGAVGEMRRNMSNLQAQAAHSRQLSVDIHAPTSGDRAVSGSETRRLEQRIKDLEGRNRALAKMLDGALDSLRASQNPGSDSAEKAEETFNISLAKIQFVSVYLSDPEIPIPPDHGKNRQGSEPPSNTQPESVDDTEQNTKPSELRVTAPDAATAETKLSPALSAAKSPRELSPSPQIGKTGSSPAIRPTLADSSFSFMLGEGRHRSSFVSSVSNLPEERRNSEPQEKPQKQLFSHEQKQKHRTGDRKNSVDTKKDGETEEDDGFTMSSLRGGGPL